MSDKKSMLRRYIFSNMVSKEQFESDPETAKQRGWFMQNEQHSLEGKYIWVEGFKNGERYGFPYFTDQEMEARYSGYAALMREREELFAENAAYPIITDPLTLLTYEREHHVPLGVVYASKFYKLVVDLIEGEAGPYVYSRVIYPAASGGTVIIPRRKDGESYRIGLLSNFRHPTRAYSGGELPRGFLDAETEQLNVKKEALEELGITEEQITDIIHLGDTHPDSGLSNNRVGIYLMDIEGECTPPIGHEGIVGVSWVSEEEIFERLRHGITDGFTQSAMLLYKLKMM